MNKIAYLACFLLVIAYRCVAAASLEIAPVQITLTPESPIAAINITNTAATKVTLQSSVWNWQKSKASDHYIVSNALIITPPLFAIAPHQTQVVRVGMRSPVHQKQQFRLLFQELPVPYSRTQTSGMHILLRIAIPIYVNAFPARTN